jgi:hypothetical protein
MKQWPKEQTKEEMIQEHLEASRRLRDEMRGNKEKSLAFLQRAGILDKDGNLAEPYRS